MFTRMAGYLQEQWYRVGLWHIFLLPLSWLFYLLLKFRRFFYRMGLFNSFRLPVPVIVVGNITVGGTGKTPLVIWLVSWLREHGFNPGVISRGYGGSAEVPIMVDMGSNPADVGDEAVLIARRAGCPVWVGRKRALAGKALLHANPVCDVLISDDGLQHYALERDVEIVVDGGCDSYGNGWLLPAGPLREPLSRLESVDAVVLHTDNMSHGNFSMNLAGAVFRNVADPAKTAQPVDFKGMNLHAIAGIGNPERFFRTLGLLGLQCAAHAFPDHYPFRAADLQFAGVQAILMTEKDAVKCESFADPRLWYLEVHAIVRGGLGERVLQRLRKR